MKNLFQDKKKLLIIGGIVTVLALVLVAAWALGWFGDKSQDTEQPQPTYHSKLTGEEVTQEESERAVLGVMIENTPQARPQTGLDAAGITFETVTEAGITRFLALYQADQPKELGPIRSLREYFVDWGMGFDAAVTHVGGSAEALNLVEERGTKSLNEFNHSGPYYRSDDRAAPHNMYARTTDLRSLMDELGYQQSQFADIPFSDSAPAETPDAQEVTLNFSGQEYQAQFRYQPEGNTYVRYQAGEPHIDAATGEPISVSNVVVVQGAGNAPIDAIGNGEALLFKNGTAQTIQWEKNSFEERIRFVDQDGNEVALSRGDTWIAVLPEDGDVEY